MNDVRILVTGGCGYIGSSLIPQLLDDDRVREVVVFDSLRAGSPANLAGTIADRLTFQRGDVREYGDVESAVRGTDVVIHLAAITGASSTHEREAETFAVNRDGTENVLTAAGKFDVENVVFASSCNNYGRATSTDIDEETSQNPLNPYAESKVAAEELLTQAVEEYGFNATALRMSTNYGWAPGIRFNLVVNHFVFRGLTGRPLTVYGDGSNWRPFIHVHDAARAYAHAALNPDQWTQQVYNVGANSANYRISEIAEIINEELGSDLDITYLEDKHPGPSYHVNFDRLGETGFELEWTLREGVRDIATELQSDESKTDKRYD
jgi:nucleoside-diphosphate-sugar epimerase